MILRGISTIGVTFMIIPAIVALIALLILISGVRERMQTNRLTSRGKQVQGRVISSHLHITNGSKNRTSRLVETIEYTTERGEQLRANPLRSDIGTLDRGGQEVTVFYDRERPERMVAPKNGSSVSPAMSLVKIAGGLVLLVIAAGFAALGLFMFGAILS